MAERRDLDLRPGDLLQAGNKPLVPGCCALEHDLVSAVVAVPHHPVEVIFEDSTEDPCHDPFFGMSERKLPGNFLVHEDRAPVGIRQRFPAHYHLADLIQVHVEGMCQFLHK